MRKCCTSSPTEGMAQAAAVLLLLFLATAPAVVRADPPAHEPPRQTVVIGGDIHYPPYEFLDENGEPSGFNVELSRAVAKAAGLDIKIRLGLWKSMRQDMENGDIDVLQGMSYSLERAKTLSFSAPYTTVAYSIFARDDSPSAASLHDLRGKAVLVEEGGAMYDFLSHSSPGIILIPTYNHENALRRLAAGHADFALVAEAAGRYMARKFGLDVHPVSTPISLEQYCYAARKDKAEVLAKLSKGLETLKTSGEYRKLSDKWLTFPERDQIPWRSALKYGAMLLAPLLAILIGSLVWSRMLRREVAARTAELKEEVRKHREAKRQLEENQKLIIHSDRMATLGVMASGIAHEINNPNGLMLMNLPIVLEAYEDIQDILQGHYGRHGDFSMGGLPYSRMRDEVPQMLTDLMESADRIRTIIHDLKEYARKSGRTDMEPLDMNQLVQTSLRFVSNAVKRATDNLSVRYADDLPPVFGNARQIQQVIINLLLNACEALDNRRKGIEVATSYDERLNAVVVTVRDEGVGISPADLDHITDPFFTTKREQGGTGLGLSVSAGIAKAHYGTMDFESAPGAGTTVTLSLPAHTSSDNAPA